jgi:hypothetical protein
MAPKKSIWILIGTAVIMAWLFGSITQAGAQTYTVKCQESGHFPQVHRIEVGDVPGHLLVVGDMAGVRSCDDGSVATISYKFTTDMTKGVGLVRDIGCSPMKTVPPYGKSIKTS